MIKHDIQRFKGFIELSNCENRVDFFARLKQVYQGFGIGQGLDVAELQSAWENGTDLPLDWRQALAAQTPIDQQAYDYFDSFKPSERLRSALFTGEPAAHWLAQGEHLAVLCAPLVRPRTLHHVLKLDTSTLSADQDSGYDATLGAGLREWAQQIADGTGQWGPVNRWLATAGAAPGMLAEILAERTVSVANVVDLSGLRLLLVLVRERLLLDQTSDDSWIDLLLTHLRNLAPTWEIRHLQSPLLWLHNYTLPLLRSLCASPRLEQMLTDEDGTERWLVEGLFQDLRAVELVVLPNDRYLHLVNNTTGMSFANLELTGALALQYPDCALKYQQRLFARRQIVNPTLDTPEAQAWYLSVIDQLDSYFFEKLFNQVGSRSTAEQLHQMISLYLCPREEQRFPWELLARLNNAEHLYSYLDCKNVLFRNQLPDCLFKLATTQPDEAPSQADTEDSYDELPNTYVKHAQNWAVLLRACERYPNLFVGTLQAHTLKRDDLERWELVWNKVEGEARVQVAGAFLEACTHKRYGAQALLVVERLYAQGAEPWFRAITHGESYYLHSELETFSRVETPLLQLLPALAARYLAVDDEWATDADPDHLAIRAGVVRALVTYPQAFAELDEKWRIRLLAVFDDCALLACADAVAKLFTSSSKTLREPAVALIARSSAAAIEAANLLAAPTKARKLVLIGLAKTSEPAGLELVNRYFKDPAHDDFSRGLSLDALERGGYSLAGLDAWADADLATLQAQAAGLKIPAAVSKYWNEEFSTLFAPLEDALGLQLLQLLFEASEQLPRRARHLLDLLPAGRRSDFALLGVQQWAAANGAVELNWLLLTLPLYGDERIANELVKAIKDWKKVRKVKASAAMHLLCQLPGNFGVSQARDLWESGKFSDSIEIAAKEALSAAAERRGMSLGEFLEQLVPDFGLTHQGLVLDVGPYQYVVRIRPDLSLLVQDENGKISKSLPKAKTGEDADKRSVAENQFKALAKNLKPVFKQQVKRLSRLFLLGSAWPSDTWQKLFIQHPLMAVLAQAVVWSADDAHGQPLQRFRPAEGGELIDLNDEPWSLPADAVVHVTHPLELEEAERAAWVTHFADYQLESPIEQWTTQIVVPEAGILAADRLPLPAGKQLNRGKFGSLVEKWGYIKGQAGDGARVNEHIWRADGGRWLVTLNHGDIDVYFDAEAKVSLENIEVHRRGAKGFERQRLGDLPRAFLNTLLSQAQTLEANAL
ncbi:hypothetical protein ACVW0Y_003711 [Pseudomonas sp. TE3786]